MWSPVSASRITIAALGHASAAASNRSSGPVPTTLATSSRTKTSGAMSTQSPWAAQAASSIITVSVMRFLSQ